MTPAEPPVSVRNQRLLFYGGLFALWALLAHFRAFPPALFPGPRPVLLRLHEGLSAPHRFELALWVSLRRIVIGYTLSVIVSLFLGLATARVRWMDNTVGSLVAGLKTLPSICWLPAALLWFGVSEAAILFVVVMGAALAISIGTHDAVRNLPPIYIRAAR